ncbi:MAG TPA: hypothetical protein VF035_00800 [Longimicrobiales bacterium]
MRRFLFCVLGAFILAASPRAAGSQEAPRTFWLIVTGLSGEAEYAASYNSWAGTIADAARTRFGAHDVTWLAEAEGEDRAGASTKAGIESALTRIASTANRTDALFIVLIGHGSFADGIGKISLPGPDLTAPDLAKLLAAVPARTVVINTASASGAWIAPLAAPGRLILTATKSGTEQNETTFPRYFADALTRDDADTDKDRRVSVLEAYEYARREVAREYAADKRMLTEHAQIDGNGDGRAVAIASPDSADGAVAALTHFGITGSAARAGASASPGAASAQQSPELRALYATKAKLEQQLADLRGRKASMTDAEYQKLLEPLLLDIARNGSEIRKLEGGQ